MKKLLALVALLLAARGAQAVDGVYVEGGIGNSVSIARAGAVWKWDRSWMYNDNWQITGAWEAAAGVMRGIKSGDPHNQVVGDIGITPVFHLAKKDAVGTRLFYEGGFLGLHLLSRAFISEGRKFGSAFEFGHFVGAGADFGAHREYSLSYRFQHMSNAGIVLPNPGVNLSELHFAYFY